MLRPKPGATWPKAGSTKIRRWRRLVGIHRRTVFFQAVIQSLQTYAQFLGRRFFPSPALFQCGQNKLFVGIGQRHAHWHQYFVFPPPASGIELEGIEIRSEEHTSELHSLMRISYAVFCLKTKN